MIAMIGILTQVVPCVLSINNLKSIKFYCWLWLLLVYHLKPFGQQRLQLAHVFEGKIKSFKSRDCSLAEVVAVEFSHSQADVSLGVT